MIRVLIVDDEALIRSGFTHILSAAEDIEVVGAVSGADALDQVLALRPDVMLLDIRMPDMDGLTILKRLRELSHPPVTAALTTFDTDEYVYEALRLGAAGFLLKDTEPEHLAYQVRALATEGAVLSAKVTRAVVAGYLDRSAESKPNPRIERLTEREREILLLLAEGKSNGEISAELFLGLGTVKDHVSSILTKLQVSNRVQAALTAHDAGLLKDTGR
ncbi:response regulator [Glycomyces algeriensis]|uniref:DNA-binding response regulator n=1 Tax=Glycomyces algeriensis TaxID=256037 RepID=A0A9W6G943_9ACTN|nr:response regulator transcription factor [Glycomyces algeriensis]MDA1365072.1 response regulator transcription factor [Glycomyces algeriensis]MDR7349866.1 DNA-binding NarL/FixJ family response regulator [Glycomyces algeriensis]GLI42577.1 DNA-binding response regulator [Glycomyces algeriensis]